MHCLAFANYRSIAHIAFIAWHIVHSLPPTRYFINKPGEKGQACLEAAVFLLTATKHVILFGFHFWIAVVLFYYVKTRVYI